MKQGGSILALYRFSSKRLIQDSVRSTQWTLVGKFTSLPKSSPSCILWGCSVPGSASCWWLEGLGQWKLAALLCSDPYAPAAWWGPGRPCLPACICQLLRKHDLQLTSEQLLMCTARSQSASAAQAIKRQGAHAAGAVPRHMALTDTVPTELPAEQPQPTSTLGQERGFCLSMKQQSKGERTLHVSMPHPLCSISPTGSFDLQISKCFCALQERHEDTMICSFQTCCGMGSC